MFGLTVAFFDLIRVFFGQVATLRGRDSGVCKTSVWNWTGVWDIEGSSSVCEIPKSLQICSSVSESASTQHNVGDFPGFGGAGCGKVPERSICLVLRRHLRLICVVMYNIFTRLVEIYYKFLHLGCPKGSWLIDTRVEVGRPELLNQLNSKRCCKILLWFHRLWCTWTCALCLTNTCSTVCCVLYSATMNFC